MNRFKRFTLKPANFAVALLLLLSLGAEAQEAPLIGDLGVINLDPIRLTGGDAYIDFQEASTGIVTSVVGRLLAFDIVPASGIENFIAFELNGQDYSIDLLAITIALNPYGGEYELFHTTIGVSENLEVGAPRLSLLFENINLTTAAVPEPASGGLLLTGIAILLAGRKYHATLRIKKVV